MHRELIDQYGRVARDLRVSLTDKCNLRCQYCMPAEGMAWLPKPEVLTDEEVVRLVRLAVDELGIHEVRFTGGEPLLRPGLPAILAALHESRPDVELSLTTNAIGLDKNARALVEAGLTRINVSLDTIDPETFKTLARRDRLEPTLKGLHAAAEAGLQPVKINSVLMPGINDDQAPDLLRYALAHNFELRFIEQMPLDADGIWRRDTMVTADQILASLREEFDLSPATEPRGSAPAEKWLVDGGPATVGVIGTVTRPFCGDCDRTRLTADGQIRNCLFARGETDLRGALRSGASDDELAEIWRGAMWTKAAGAGIDDPKFLKPTRSMSAIGG
ncbi:GTP 3',8-cyclase MoaA [Salininema proteolyticum]|uniref:GTP 3',8-cyclase n=1 Tax=Salininema proteolyticum TaxID=1607685 RepID=A0ABV8U6C6_9ACTN